MFGTSHANVTRLSSQKKTFQTSRLCTSKVTFAMATGAFFGANHPSRFSSTGSVNTSAVFAGYFTWEIPPTIEVWYQNISPAMLFLLKTIFRVQGNTKKNMPQFLLCVSTIANMKIILDLKTKKKQSLCRVPSGPALVCKADAPKVCIDGSWGSGERNTLKKWGSVKSL